MKTRLATLLIATFVLAAQAWAFTGTVVRIIDGDTLTVGQVRVRLYGIDAPELDQPGGFAARDYLRALAQGREVEVVPVDQDAYGRTVGRVLLPDGSEASASMVEAGHAWVYWKYCRDCAAWGMSESRARLRGLGLWAEPDPIAPWKWRHEHRRLP